MLILNTVLPHTTTTTLHIELTDIYVYTNAPATTDDRKLRLSRTVFHISQSGHEHLSRHPDITPDTANTL